MTQPMPRSERNSQNRVARLADAIFTGFTGTPLLRKDRQTTREVRVAISPQNLALTAL